MAVHSCVIWTMPHAGRAVWRVLFQHSPFAAVQLSARLMLGTLRPSGAMQLFRQPCKEQGPTGSGCPTLSGRSFARLIHNQHAYLILVVLEILSATT